MTAPFKQFFISGLDKLSEEVSKFNHEEDLWKISGDISNCSGNLALHLLGNTFFFIGAQLGGTGYVRDRDREFSEKNVPKEKMLAMIAEAKAIVEKTFDTLPDDALKATYPLDYFNGPKSTFTVLLILISHFQYHLGQINYLRRVVSQDSHK